MPKNQYYTEAELKKIFTNLKRKGFTDVMANMLISHTYNRPVNTRTSGFYYPGNPDATLVWSNTTRTVSLTPVDPGEPVYDPKGNLYVPNFRFYVWDREARMQRKEEVETLQLPNEEGLFLIHFGVNQDTRRYELLYIKNPEIDEIALTYIQGVPVAWLYWAYDLQQALYFGDSRHGSEWNPQMHWMLHQTLNSQRQSGLALTNVTYDGDGTSNGDYQFGISAGELWHDDIFAETDAVGEADSLPVWYFDAAGLPRFSTSAGKKFLNTGTGRVAFNGITGGLAEAPDMSFVVYHLFATNCTLYPHISVMGQESHTTLGAAVGSIEAEVATLRQDLPHANLMHIASFVLQTSDGYTNGGKAIIVYTSAAEDVFVTDTDFNTDTGILTLFRSANRPPLEQPLDIGKLVVEAINNYPETITDIVNNIATTIVQNGIASMKESYLIDPVNDTSFTQLSSWFVEAPNELMGDFRAVVVVRDKTTHAIVTLQNTMGFDYTDAANEVEDDKAIITDGSITLVLSVDATTNNLKAVLSGMTANAKRIHFCFERCANNTQPPLTLDHVSGEGTIHEPTLESEATLELEHLEGEGTVNEVTAEDPWADAFITEWNMPAGDFTLPIYSGGSYNMEVDWGDGSTLSTITSFSDVDKTHNYLTAATIQIKIRGKCGSWRTTMSSFKHLITKVIQWGYLDLEYIDGMFSGAVNLIELPSGPITGASSVLSCNSIFHGCTSLQSIPTGLLDNLTLVTSGHNMFSNCTAIQSIPVGLFDNNTEILNLHFVFEGCTSLQSIPSGLFNTLTLAEDFSNLFDGCTSLQSIPSGLFDNNTEVINFSRIFVNTAIQSIPSELFDNNTEVVNMGQMFKDCTSLQSIPSGLFDNNILVETFSGVFYGCTSLESIPVGLFDNNTEVVNMQEVFRFCDILQSIPSGLFDNNILVETFLGAFSNCTSLESIPVGLFDNNTEVTSFSTTFNLCSSLISIPDDLYDNCNLVTTFYRCHGMNTSFFGNVPDLWNSHSSSNGLQCFFACTNAANYSLIPSGWK